MGVIALFLGFKLAGTDFSIVDQGKNKKILFSCKMSINTDGP